MDRTATEQRFVESFGDMTEETFVTHTNKGFAVTVAVARDPVWQGNQIALMHGELSEAHEGIRKDLMDDKLTHRKAVEVELADTVIRIMNFARQMGLNVAGAIVEKNRFNATRPHMHGDKKF